MKAYRATSSDVTRQSGLMKLCIRVVIALLLVPLTLLRTQACDSFPGSAWERNVPRLRLVASPAIHNPQKSCVQEESPKNARPPNIVLIYADNLGYGDLGCYGNQEVKTPRLDQLAREGVRCTDFYVVSSTCTVSRGAILTGRQPFRNGLTHQLATTENWTGIGLPHRERILSQYLQNAGYDTACFGKWNIGFAPGSRPTERGFDEFLGCRSGNIHYFKHTYHGAYDIYQGIELHRVEGYSTEVFADAACDYVQRKAGRPFFVYLPFNAPHYVSTVNTSPGEKPEWHVPGKYLERYGWSAEDHVEKHRYLALLTALDDGVGRVLDTLDATGQRDNTLVMFISDMGAILRPTHGLGVASNLPFRDGAPSLYEGGIRVPAIFRWPGKIKPGTQSQEMLSHLDVLPLCLAASGAKPFKDRVLDGRDPLPALAGTAKSPHQCLVFTYGTASALREGTLKIVRSAATKPWELYDLAGDPAEAKNLATERPADVARLDTAYQTWLVDVRRDASERAPRPVKSK
jgi:arylsulfatase A